MTSPSATSPSAEARLQPSQVAPLHEVTLLLTRRLRKHSETELTLSQMSALSTLQRNGAMRVSDLARREQLSKSSATKIVAKLEEMSYLAREADPADGRSFQVTITEHGHAMLAESSRRASEFLAEDLGRLTEEQRAAILAALPALQALVAPSR